MPYMVIPRPVVEWVNTSDSIFANNLRRYRERNGTLADEDIAKVEAILGNHKHVVEPTTPIKKDVKSTVPHPVIEWINTNQSSFAASLRSYYERTGKLSDGQIAKVEEIIRNASQSQKPADDSKPKVAVDKLMDAFNTARKNGVKFAKGPPTLRFESFKASQAPMTGANPGGVYIKGNDGTYLGKIVNGIFVKTRECSDAMVGIVIKTMDNPLKAAIEYGKKTVHCSCCGIRLTNDESRRLGIGPICREKWGL